MTYRPAIRNASSRIVKALRQHGAITGRYLQPGELEEVVRGELGAEAGIAIDRARLAESKRQFDVQASQAEKERKAATRASAIGGAVQIGALGYELGVNRPKELAILERGIEAQNKILSGLTTTPTAATTAAAPTGAIATEATTAAAPTTAQATATGATKSIAKAAGYATIGGIIGGGLARAAGAGRVGRRNTAAAGGAVAGFMAGGPVGALVGAGLAAFEEDTVICRELYRQGYIDNVVLSGDSAYCGMHIDKITYAGYRMWADPTVKLMRKSKIITLLIAPFGISWARTMAHRMYPYVKANLAQRCIGNLLLYVGVPMSRTIFFLSSHRRDRHA